MICSLSPWLILSVLQCVSKRNVFRDPVPKIGSPWLPQSTSEKAAAPTHAGGLSPVSVVNQLHFFALRNRTSRSQRIASAPGQPGWRKMHQRCSRHDDWDSCPQYLSLKVTIGFMVCYTLVESRKISWPSRFNTCFSTIAPKRIVLRMRIVLESLEKRTRTQHVNAMWESWWVLWNDNWCSWKRRDRRTGHWHAKFTVLRVSKLSPKIIIKALAFLSQSVKPSPCFTWLHSHV